MITKLQPERRTATVNSVGVNTVNVYIGGDTSQDYDLPFLDSYDPIVGDTVVLLGNQGDYVVAGVPRGATGAQSPWVPTLSNLVVGNGTYQAYYIQIKKLLFLSYNLNFGSSTAISGVIHLTLPSPCLALLNQDIQARVISNGGTASWDALMDIAAGSNSLTCWLPQAVGNNNLNSLGGFALTMGAGSTFRFNGHLWVQ